MSASLPVVGESIQVTVTKITLGKDNKLYITIRHPNCLNNPTLIWNTEASVKPS